jgi:Golgi apparatus protein 1
MVVLSRGFAALLLVAGLGLPAAPARADMMTACAADIQKFCQGVDRGRGRISACLASEMGRIGAGCRAEVQAVMQGPLTPRYVRAALNPGFKVALPQVCAAPAKSLCPGIPAGDGRVLACLYARSDRAGRACTTAAEAAMRGQ